MTDRQNRKVLAVIDRERRGQVRHRCVTLRAHWSMEPSLNYYRYTYQPDLDTILELRDTLPAVYPDLGTALFRVDARGE